MKKEILLLKAVVRAIVLTALLCTANQLAAATLSLDMPTTGAPGKKFPVVIGFGDAANVVSFELTMIFASGSLLSTGPETFTANSTFFPMNAQIGGQVLNFLSSPMSGKIYVVGLSPAATSGGVSIGSFVFTVSATAQADDTQVVTIGGKAYTSAGVVENLTPVSKMFTVATFVDSDHDGMDDAWEMAYFGTLSRDGTGDYDMDGLTDLEEYQMGLNPTVFDAGNLIPGDIDNSKSVDLNDAVLGLQVVMGAPVNKPIYKGTDINQDGKIGIPEVIYILKKIAGMIP